MPTQLHEVLPYYTTMPVDLITEQMSIEPDHVFVIPENRDLHVHNGVFRLKPISKPRGWPDVITVFLRSLTQCWDGKLIAIIVSGYDGDGAAALRGIKEVGGIPLRKNSVQQPSQTCRRAQSTVDASILSCRRKRSLVKLCELHALKAPTPGMAQSPVATSQ